MDVEKLRIMKLTLLLFLISVHLGLNAQVDSLSVLFVGNSYTYFWNLPQHVASMARTQNIPMVTRQSTNGGVTLANHWKGERDLRTQSLIRDGKFDHVVLQDNSLWPLMYADTTLKYGELLGKLISGNGGKALIYLTWGRKGNPLIQPVNNKVYQKLAQRINAEIVPVGPAWMKAEELDPTIELYDPDGSHPSAVGTYLTACVFYAVITDKSPVGLPNRLTYLDVDGEKIYLNILPQRQALFCQQVAWEIVEEWNQ